MAIKRYEKFRGVDFSTDPALIDDSRSPFCQNLVSDNGGYPEKRLGWETKQTYEDRINGIFRLVDQNGDEHFLVHHGTKLTHETFDGNTSDLSTGMNDDRSFGFYYADKLYLLDGAHYLVYDGAALQNVTDDGVAFVPTTIIGASPDGAGTTLEAANLLCGKQKNSFIGDGGTPEKAQLQFVRKASAGGNVIVTLNGVQTNVSIQSTDSITQLAGKVAQTTFAGYTTEAVGDTVTFTATSVGQRSAPVFSAESTGCSAYISDIQKGSNAAAVYRLSANSLDAGSGVVVSVNGATVPSTYYTLDRNAATVTFVAGHEPPGGEGVDNVVITFTKTTDGYADRIRKCRFATWFGAGGDSRVFVSGNPDYKNWDFYSGLYDPTYFPDTGYTRVGSDASAVMGYLRQYDNLLIIKEDNDQDATMFVRTAEITTTSELDASGDTITRTVTAFPLQQGVAGVGAVSRYAFGTLRDDPLFLSAQGVFTPTLTYGGANMQRAMQNRSHLVDSKLTNEENLDAAVAAVWNGYYVLCVNGRCYVADSRQRTGKSGTEGTGYEWYYWTNVHARVMTEIEGELWFGTSEGALRKFRSDEATGKKYNDDDDPIDAVWATKRDDDGDFMLLKTMERLGSGVLIKPYSRSSVQVSAKTEDVDAADLGSKSVDIFDFNNLDFERFTFSTDDSPDVLPFTLPVRRYRTLQIIARNVQLNEGFGVYGFVKRFHAVKYVK